MIIRHGKDQYSGGSRLPAICFHKVGCECPKSRIIFPRRLRADLSCEVWDVAQAVIHHGNDGTIEFVLKRVLHDRYANTKQATITSVNGEFLEVLSNHEVYGAALKPDVWFRTASCTIQNPVARKICSRFLARPHKAEQNQEQTAHLVADAHVDPALLPRIRAGAKILISEPALLQRVSFPPAFLRCDR